MCLSNKFLMMAYDQEEYISSLISQMIQDPIEVLINF